MKRLSHILENSYILTQKGYDYIENLLGYNIIWDGYKWKEVNIIQNNEILKENIYYKIIFSDGCEITCDANHKLYTVDNMISNIYRTTPIINIKENTLIYKYYFPLIEGNIEFDIKYPYFIGYLLGYIYNFNNINNDNISNEKIKELYTTYLNSEINNDIDYELLLQYTNDIYNKLDIKNPINIPINASMKNRLLWISGLIDINGFITNIKDGIYLNIIVNSKSFAMQVKYLFNTLGTNPKIIENTEIRKFLLLKSSNNSENVKKDVKKRFIILFNADDTNKIFLDYDINTYYFTYDKTQYSLDQDINRYLSIKKIIKITDIKKTYSIQNTYSIISNGILI